MGNLRARQTVRRLSPDPCGKANCRFQMRASQVAPRSLGVRHRGGNLERSCQNRTPPVSCPPSSLLRPSGCDRFWHLGSAPLGGSLGSSPRFGILFWRFPRSTDFTANPLSSSAADCQFLETRCDRRQEYRKEGLIDEVSMRAESSDIGLAIAVRLRLFG